MPTAIEQQKIIIKDTGHFLQEKKGAEIAGYIEQFMKGELKTSGRTAPSRPTGK